MIDHILFASLVAMVVFIGYWFALVWLRRRAEKSWHRPRERQFPGTAFDVSTISPEIQRVRRDFLTEKNSRPTSASGQEKLTAARRLVRSFSFFQRAEREDERQKTDA